MRFSVGSHEFHPFLYLIINNKAYGLSNISLDKYTFVLLLQLVHLNAENFFTNRCLSHWLIFVVPRCSWQSQLQKRVSIVGTLKLVEKYSAQLFDVTTRVSEYYGIRYPTLFFFFNYVEHFLSLNWVLSDIQN